VPLHPRTKKALLETGITLDAIHGPPVPYLEMLWLLQHSRMMLTDSGGLPKEAYFLGKRSIIMLNREEQEWPELCNFGAATYISPSSEAMLDEVQKTIRLGLIEPNIKAFGNGNASLMVSHAILARHNHGKIE
jgi:UDP-GlcNAc3NAcA epimerase